MGTIGDIHYLSVGHADLMPLTAYACICLISTSHTIELVVRLYGSIFVWLNHCMTVHLYCYTVFEHTVV